MTQAKMRAWVWLPSGRRLDLINPGPGTWLDNDLALRLARTYRWDGESSWPLPLSVAQHSLLVLTLYRLWGNTPLPASDALLELLHDAKESFLGSDCISPLKDVLGLSFRATSSRLMIAISKRYELRTWSPAAYAIRKWADSVAAASEAVHCIGWTTHEAHDILGTIHSVLNVNLLAEIYGCRPRGPWAADVMTEWFLDALESSHAAVHGQIEAQTWPLGVSPAGPGFHAVHQATYGVSPLRAPTPDTSMPCQHYTLRLPGLKAASRNPHTREFRLWIWSVMCRCWCAESTTCGAAPHYYPTPLLVVIMPLGQASPVKGRAALWNPHPFGVHPSGCVPRAASGFSLDHTRPACPWTPRRRGRWWDVKADPALRWPCG